MTITNIQYGNPAGSPQSWMIEYKLASDTAGPYTVADADAEANETGVLDTPLDVSLSSGQVYIFRISNNCGSPRDYYYQYVTT